MTIANEQIKNQYTADGMTNIFQFSFKAFSDAAVKVIVLEEGEETTLVLGTDYTVSRSAVGGSVTLSSTALAPEGSTVTIISGAPYTQQTVYVEGDKFPAASHEDALDKATLLILQIKEWMARALVGARSDDGAISFELPAALQRAGKYLQFDENGQPVAKNLDFEFQHTIDRAHDQNTDTGTSAIAFTLGADGLALRNSAGDLYLRNAANTEWRGLAANILTAISGEIIIGQAGCGVSRLEMWNAAGRRLQLHWAGAADRTFNLPDNGGTALLSDASAIDAGQWE